MMNLLRNFTAFIASTKNIYSSHHTFLLAISGGVDSVVLCDLFAKSNLQFSLAHCNFQLRGAESERDELFVKELAAKYSCPISIKHFDTKTYAAEHKLSTQVAARNLRYDWFKSLAFTEGKADYIVTAHHADDNIETVVMNFFRGTGLRGLAGMEAQHEKILRPLLLVRKKDILSYATTMELPFVEDSSNATNNYTRNYFRNELIPGISKVFAGFEDNILHNIERFSGIEKVYREAIESHKRKLLLSKDNELHIPILKLVKTGVAHTLLWEILKDLGYTANQVTEVLKLETADNGSYVTSASHRVIKNRKWLIITTLKTENAAHITIDKIDDKIIYEGGQLHMQNTNKNPLQIVDKNSNEIIVDAEAIKYPMILRRCKTGDYFYPLGMQKKKKISRFLIDLKLSATEKEKVWLLESNNKIVWVIGYRIDDRFKITPKTTQVLQVERSEK